MLKQTIKKIFKPKSFIALALVLLVILVAPVKTAHATVSETVLDVLGWGISFFVSSLGMLLSVVISAMVEVAQYNKFLSAPPVAVGWGIVRDLCNMFFVLILLIIAFATILHIPNYSIKQLLKRVIIFAILINFSKMICGLLIDFAQVIMLTFVNGFKDIGGANMSTLLGMDQLLSLNIDKQIADMPDKATFWSVVGSYFLALIYVIIMLVVMVALLGTLVFRIITLWIYIILSPLAYLGAVVPATKGITSAWWKQFSQSLITGPILAFFIWLSLATLGQYNNSTTFLQQTGFNVPDPKNAPLAGTTDVGTTGHMMRFAISIGLLIGGLMVAKQFGGSAGGAISGVVSRAQRGASWMKKKTGAVAKGAVVAVGRRPAYAVADKGLGALKAIPLVGPMATRQQAKLREKRDRAEEKDTKYMKYLDNEDLNRMTRSKGVLMESKRQDYNRALMEKIRRSGAVDWGHNTAPAGTVAEAARNKTRTAIDTLKAAGHSLNRGGDDTFRDEDMGKKAMDFLKTNPGHIDQATLRNYYAGLNAQGAQQYGANFEANGMGIPVGAPHSENIVEHFARRMSSKDLQDIHHSQLTNEVLNAIAPVNPATGLPRANKKLAKTHDDTTEAKRERLDKWADEEYGQIDPATGLPIPGSGVARVFGDRTQANPGSIGRPFMVKGQTFNPAVASGGVTGLNNIAKGRFSVDFAELNLPPNAVGQYISDPKEKQEVISRLSDKLRSGGMSEEQVASTANQLSSLSYLMLRNKGANVDLATSKAAQAHEWSHARVDQNFSEDEKRGIWDSLDDNTKTDARQKIKAIWGDSLPEEGVIEEYLAEGLRNKTRWNKDAPVSLSGQAESSMNQILARKGTSVNQLASNITDTRPLVAPGASPAEVREVVAEKISRGVGDSMSGDNFDPTLVSAMKNLTKTLGEVGNGLDALGGVARSFSSLDSAIHENTSYLASQARIYKENTSGLEKLSRSVKGQTT